MGKLTDDIYSYHLAKRELELSLKLQKELPNKIKRLKKEVRDFEKEYGFGIKNKISLAKKIFTWRK